MASSLSDSWSSSEGSGALTAEESLRACPSNVLLASSTSDGAVCDGEVCDGAVCDGAVCDGVCDVDEWARLSPGQVASRVAQMSTQAAQATVLALHAELVALRSQLADTRAALLGASAPHTPTGPNDTPAPATPPTTPAAPSVLSGWLQKRDPTSGLWRKYFVVLEGPPSQTMVYYDGEDEADRVCLGRFVFGGLELDVVFGARIREYVVEDVPFAVALVCRDRALHVFSAVTGVEMLNWATGLGQVIAGASEVAVPGTQAVMEEALNDLVASVFFLRRRAQYASKVSRKGRLLWGTQYACLYNWRLYFYESEDAIRPLESVCVVGYTARPLTSDSARANSFRLSHPGLPSYTLAVESRKGLATWIGALAAASSLEKRWFLPGNKDYDARAEPATASVSVSISLDPSERDRTASLRSESESGSGPKSRGGSISERRKRLARRQTALSRALSVADLKHRISSKLLTAYKYRDSLSIDDVVSMLREFHGLEPIASDDYEYEYASASCSAGDTESDDCSSGGDGDTLVIQSSSSRLASSACFD